MSQAPSETRVIEAVRPFRHEGKEYGIGSVVELPRGLANIVISGGKAKPVDPDTKRVHNKKIDPPKKLAMNSGDGAAKAG